MGEPVTPFRSDSESALWSLVLLAFKLVYRKLVNLSPFKLTRHFIYLQVQAALIQLYDSINHELSEMNQLITLACTFLLSTSTVATRHRPNVPPLSRHLTDTAYTVRKDSTKISGVHCQLIKFRVEIFLSASSHDVIDKQFQ